jgi:hypothetical protein
VEESTLTEEVLNIATSVES